MVNEQTVIATDKLESPECSAATPAAGTGRDETDTEKGNRWFLERVRQVPGVVHVEPFGGKTLGEQSFAVYVRDGDEAAEYGVYAVEGEVYDRYPDAQLHVELWEQSDLPDSPPGTAAAER